MTAISTVIYDEDAAEPPDEVQIDLI
jgi:hypothetical protein